MILYHGSEKIVETPIYGKGAAANDFGRGFYCTEHRELAKEWACRKNSNGFVNRYELDLTGLKIMDLTGADYHILNWLALLTRYRGYWQARSIAEEAKDYLQVHYLPDISEYDVIIGFRADDSYFSFAQDFVSGTISLQTLSKAMQLGKLGIQVVIKSQKAFKQLKFMDAAPAMAEEYYNRKCSRDLGARRAYAAEKQKSNLSDDIYILDILRGRVNDDELRL